jgi:5-hydroxyisourate hydrolase-like protein (transthyretin family)
MLALKYRPETKQEKQRLLAHAEKKADGKWDHLVSKQESISFCFYLIGFCVLDYFLFSLIFDVLVSFRFRAFMSATKFART